MQVNIVDFLSVSAAGRAMLRAWRLWYCASQLEQSFET